jgi:RNA polymerase sigma-70 factor, ECF subfamily
MKLPEMGSWRDLRSSCPAMSMVDFAQIAREQSPGLYRRARQLTNDDAHAWDLVQDTFERCLRCFPPALPEAKVRPWLLAILNNLFIDETRTLEARTRVTLPAEDLEQVPESALSPQFYAEESGAEVWRAYDPNDVRACLGRLPEVLRETFVLHEVGGLNYREIAARLNVNRATVGTRILRARRHLCRFLRASGPARRPETAQFAQELPAVVLLAPRRAAVA